MESQNVEKARSPVVCHLLVQASKKKTHVTKEIVFPMGMIYRPLFQNLLTK